MQIDLHGLHPGDVCGDPLRQIIQQAWEMGESEIRLVHGHGRGRGISPGFVNTNTGYFGLRIRSELRHDKKLRQWIKYTTLNCDQWGSTCVKLKSNRSPSRTAIDPLPAPRFRDAR